MCGIAGGIGIGREHALRMQHALRHRGPDGCGLTQLHGAPSEAWFAHTRLAIIDLTEAASQPMTDPDTGNVLVFNGEIYNYRAVRENLASMGERFHSNSDTEVVLKAYARWGQACLEHLDGMFAFAIWDTSKQSLFLARDRFGIKPLYYVHDARTGRFLFASEVRALLASDVVPRRLSLEGVHSYLSTGSLEDPVTIVEGVSALLPGHAAEWHDGHFKIREYWDLPLPAAGSSNGNGVPIEELRELMQNAAQRHTVADVPVSIFLSGGIDSSGLVSLLSGPERPPVQTFSIGFGEAAYDESAYAEEVARAFGACHHHVALSSEDVAHGLDAATSAYDQPSVDGINSYVIAQAVRQAGYKVALSGLGADEIFAGYRAASLSPRLERAQQWLGHVPHPARTVAVGAMARLMPKTDASRKLAEWARSDPGDGPWLHPYYMGRALFGPSQVDSLLATEAGALLGESIGQGEVAQRRRTLLGKTAGADPVNRYLYLESRSYLPNMLLRDIDAMSMAHGLEARVPYLDHHLAEKVASLPGAAKLRRGTPKPLLLGALTRPLPESVVYRPKRGFTLPWEEWLRGPLGQRVKDAIFDPPSCLRGVLNEGAVRQVWDGFQSGRHSWSRVWALYSLATWSAAHLETTP